VRRPALAALLLFPAFAGLFAGGCCTRLPRLAPKSLALPEPPPEYAEVVTTHIGSATSR
jgi:hypothetical protein